MLARKFVGTLFGLAALASTGCVTDSTSIYVLGVTIGTGDNCEYSTQTTLAGATVVDPNAGSATVGLIVGNLLRKRDLTIGNDPSTVIVETADIQINDAQNNAVNAFSVDVGFGAISGSTNGSTPGTGVVVVPIFPATALAALSPGATYMVDVTLHGRTLGHIDVEGGVFSIMVTVGSSGSLGIDCATTGAEVGPCCSAGVNQQYCTDTTNAGNCVAR